MIGDREIWACAHLLLKQHGTNAKSFAAHRADELLAEGNAAGHRTFRRIVRCIGELETVEPSGPLN